ncbi:MAG: hypothetical protein ACI8U4_002578, partial [Natronomonas sp.]
MRVAVKDSSTRPLPELLVENQACFRRDDLV